MTRPELVLFDLDGTLLDGAGLPGAMRATCTVLAERLPGVEADDLVAANTAVWQRLWPEVEDEYQLGGRSGDALVLLAWRETLRAVGSDDPGLLGAAAEEWQRQQCRTFRAFGDVLPAFAELDAARLRIGMITNGSGTVQRLKLRTVGLLQRLDPLVISSEVGLRKPDPQIFEVALHRAGVQPDAAWFVGDNLWHDIAPAAGAGLRTAWIDRRPEATPLDPSWPQPDEAIRSLEHLLPLMHGRAQDPL